MTRPIIILGAGGHGKVLLSTLLAAGEKVLGLTDSNHDKHGGEVLGISVLGDDTVILQHQPQDIRLALGVGSVRVTAARSLVFEKFNSLGYDFPCVIHPSATIAGDVTIDAGAQIMAATVVQPGTKIRRNVIVNTGAIIDHDCCVMDHAHLAPRVVLSGSVKVGEGAMIGTGAVVIQGILIGRNTCIGAGACVVQDVEDGHTVAGVPARRVVHE